MHKIDKTYIIRFVVCLMSLSFGINIGYGQGIKQLRNDSFQILSWNIQMLPDGFNFLSEELRKKQKERLSPICEFVKQADCEIVVFQEVFDRGIAKNLKSNLKDKYPYQVEAEGRWNFLTSSGILILSKYPLTVVADTIYQRGVGADGLASKGCTIAEVEVRGQKMRIAGTHLQAGQSDKEVKSRSSQIRIMKDFFKSHESPMPFILAGDLNTKRSDVLRFKRMLRDLKLKERPLDDDRPFTVDPNNYWNHGDAKQLDYILEAKHNVLISMTNLQVIRPTYFSKAEEIDLSDHYGLIATFVIF